MRVLLLPGMDGTGRLFERFQRAAPAGTDACALSYPPDLFLDYPALAQRVVMQLPDEPFLLLGESFSGPVALAIAAARPPGLIGVVLCASFARALPRALAHAPWQLAFRLRPPLALLRHFLAGGDDALARAARAAIDAVAPEVLARRLRAVLSCDARAELSACPGLLYLQAAADRLVPDRCGAEIVRLAGAELCSLPGPHLLLQARPELAWSAIARFAGALGARRAA